MIHLPPGSGDALLPPGNATVPLASFSIVRLRAGEAAESHVEGHETCLVPATGTVEVAVDGRDFGPLGSRGSDVWDGEPEGLYVPLGASARLTATRDAEVLVAGARCEETFEPFTVDLGF